MVTVELIKSYCLPFMLYGTEAVPLSNRTVYMLDSSVSTTIAEIFSVAHIDNILCIRELLNLPKLADGIEDRKQQFMDRIAAAGFSLCCTKCPNCQRVSLTSVFGVF